MVKKNKIFTKIDLKYNYIKHHVNHTLRKW